MLHYLSVQIDFATSVMMMQDEKCPNRHVNKFPVSLIDFMFTPLVSSVNS